MNRNNHSFFQNTACEHFPCHKVSNIESFNCLFCYCPLYALGNQCGGNFTYTKSGKKNCSNCLIPHSEDGYEFVLSKLVLLDEKMRCMEERNNDTVSD